MLNELYKRPCFASCSDCGDHGAIIFKDGSKSEPIMSIEEGKKILKGLVSSKKISSDESDRIEDHLECSELPSTEKEASILALLSLACLTLKEIEKSERAHWN